MKEPARCKITMISGKEWMVIQHKMKVEADIAESFSLDGYVIIINKALNKLQSEDTPTEVTLFWKHIESIEAI